jgi:putative acetyltransferase
MAIPSVLIRREVPGDLSGVLAVNRAAFGGDAEAELVACLHADGDTLRGLVAVEGNRIVGHVLFSRLMIETERDAIAVAALAPLAVVPERQRLGIGTALVSRGLDACREMGLAGAVVLGDPAFYGRFGFRAEHAASFRTPWSGPHLMAIELIPGGLGARSGILRYAAAFARLPD